MQGLQFTCAEGKHNDLATAFYSTDDNLLDRMFSVGQDFSSGTPTSTQSAGFSHSSLFIYSVVYLITMALASGICIPAGLFMPAIMLGASMGLNAGLYLQAWLPHWHIQPGTHSSCRGRARCVAVLHEPIVCSWFSSARPSECCIAITASCLCANFVPCHMNTCRTAMPARFHEHEHRVARLRASATSLVR